MLLLSSFHSLLELDGGLIIDQIRNLDLLVNVAWIGGHLNRFVQDLTSRDVPVLFFNWVPNDLTASGNYSRIHFPLCRTSNERPVDCDFEVHQLMKMMWATMKSHTPEAYHLISQARFRLSLFSSCQSGLLSRRFVVFGLGCWSWDGGHGMLVIGW